MEKLELSLLELKRFVKEANDKCLNGENVDDDVKEMTIGDSKISKFPRYSRRPFLYQNKCRGYDVSLGEVIVQHVDPNISVWGMNYFGFKTNPSIDFELTFNFLKEALRNCSEDEPMRGPPRYKSQNPLFKNFEYSRELTGDFKGFVGEEKIIYQADLSSSNRIANSVFEQWFHGGVPKHKELEIVFI